MGMNLQSMVTEFTLGITLYINQGSEISGEVCSINNDGNGNPIYVTVFQLSGSYSPNTDLTWGQLQTASLQQALGQAGIVSGGCPAAPGGGRDTVSNSRCSSRRRQLLSVSGSRSLTQTTPAVANGAFRGSGPFASCLCRTCPCAGAVTSSELTYGKGSTADLTNADAGIVSFVPDVEGQYGFIVSVSSSCSTVNSRDRSVYNPCTVELFFVNVTVTCIAIPTTGVVSISSPAIKRPGFSGLLEHWMNDAACAGATHHDTKFVGVPGQRSQMGLVAGANVTATGSVCMPGAAYDEKLYCWNDQYAYYQYEAGSNCNDATGNPQLMSTGTVGKCNSGFRVSCNALNARALDARFGFAYTSSNQALYTATPATCRSDNCGAGFNGVVAPNGVTGGGFNNEFWSAVGSASEVASVQCAIRSTAWSTVSFKCAAPYNLTSVTRVVPPAPVRPETSCQIYSSTWTIAQTPCCSNSCNASRCMVAKTQTSCDMNEGCQWVAGTATATTGRYVTNAAFVGGWCGFEAPTGQATAAATSTFVPKTVRLYNQPKFTRFSGCAARSAASCLTDNLCTLNGGLCEPIELQGAEVKCIYAPGEVNEYQGDPSCTSGVGMSVSAGTTTAVETESANGAFKITTPGFIPQWPGMYKLAYTVYDGCHAPVTKMVTINAQCSSDSVNVPDLQDVATSFDCQKPSGDLGFNGGFTAVSLQGARTTSALETGVVNRVPATWLADPTGPTEAGWKAPSCVIPAMSTAASTCEQWSTNVATVASLPATETVESCCKCVYGSGSTVNVNAGCGSSSSGSSGSGTSGTPSGNAARSGLEALTETEGSNLSLLLGLIIPLGLLLVFSVALNVYLLNDSRRKSPQLQADSSNRDVELSIAPSRNV